MNRAASISDQFFAASEKFHAARDAYAAERQFLSELEQQLLKYTEEYQALPEQAEYVGDGSWRVFNGTLSAAKRGEQNPYWVYVCNTLSDGRVSFEEASEAVAFLAGQYMADQCHEERARIIAKGQEGDATELTVAT